MSLYLTVILGGMFFIAACVALCYETSYLQTLGFTALAIILIILVDGMVATVARLLPKRFAEHTKKHFTVSMEEKKLYEKLKIRLWKDKIPEIGHFTRFRKNKIVDPKNVAYIERFLLECCYGQIGHFWSVIFGFIILLFYPLTHTWVSLSLPVAIVNGVLNLLPICVLRYNVYKLKILLKTNLKKLK